MTESFLSKHSLIVSFDRMPVRFLGCYGSLICQTPHFDRFASQASVFDFHFARDLNESRTAHDWWRGGLSFCADSHNLRSQLVTNRIPVEWDIAPSGFEAIEVIESGAESLSRLFSAAIVHFERLVNEGEQFLLWVHVGELSELPVPSNAYLDLYLDELIPLPEMDDTEDPADAPLPAELRDEAIDLVEDTLERVRAGGASLELQHVKTLSVLAAARVSEIDHEFGRLISVVDTATGGSTRLLAITADRGLSLGESMLTSLGQYHEQNLPLGEATMHVPCMIRAGEGPHDPRSNVLSQPADLSATLRSWFGGSSSHLTGIDLFPVIRGTRDVAREQCVITDGEWEALRTHEWLLLRHQKTGIERLFTKPEDIWEVLDVLPQYSQLADDLHARLEAILTENAD